MLKGFKCGLGPSFLQRLCEVALAAKVDLCNIRQMFLCFAHFLFPCVDTSSYFAGALAHINIREPWH